MRFQQLKHDPNTIEKKRLVKSKKNWVVLSSLSIAGGLFLLSAPSVLVKADTTNNQVQTTLTAKAPSTETQSATDKLAAVASTTTDNTAKETRANQITATPKANATPVSSTTDTKSSGTVETQTATPEAGTSSTNSTQADTSKADTTENVNSKATSDTTTTESKDTPVAEKTLATNLAISKTKLTNLGVKAELLSITPEAATLPDGNIAESTQGTTPWYISADGVLHLGTASSTTALADNTATTTNKTSESTDKTSTGSSTTGTTTESTTPTSPWATNADSINTIIFDGKVTAATDMNHMFANLTNLKNIENIDNLDTSNTTNTSGMFANDTNLVDATNVGETHTSDNQKLDLSSLNFYVVQNSSKMFLNDSSVTEIDLPTKTDTAMAKSSDASFMFKNDINLKTISLKYWQFYNHKNLTGMFQNDKSLETLDLSSWSMSLSTVDNETGDSSKGEGMFDGTNLKSITLSPFDRFKNYTDLPSMKSNHWYDSKDSVIFSTMTANNNGKTLGTLFTKENVPQITPSFTLEPKSGETVKMITATMSIPSNLGNQNLSVEGTLNSAVTNVGIPQIPGYTSDISTVNGTIINDTTATTNYYITYTGDPVNKWTASVTLPDGSTKEITGIKNDAGKAPRVGDKVTFDTPTVAGYDVTPSTITGTINSKGDVDFDNPTYSQKQYTNTVTIKSNLPNRTVSVTGPVGPVKIDVPKVDGYTTSPSQITGTINSDGTITLDPNQDITYTGNPVTNASATIKATQNGTTKLPDISVDGISGNVGDTVDVKVPTKEGYTSPESVKGVIQPDGKTVLVKEPVNYVGVAYTDSPATIKSNLGDQHVDHLSGKVGETVTVNVPNVEGYTADKSTVTGLMNPGGSITSTDVVTYTSKKIDTGTATINTPKGSKVISGLTGTVDKKGGVTITVPDVQGYTPDKSTITGTMNSNGTVTPNETVNYTPNNIKDVTTTITTSKGDKTVSGLTGIVDKKGGVTIKVPDVQGYTPDKSTITGTMNPDGTVTPNETVNYIPNNIKDVTTTITTSKGDKTVSGLTGIVDKKDGVTIKVPDVPGYTPDKSTITGTMNPDGTVTPNETVNYTPNNIKDASTTISTSKGNKTVSGLTGTVDKKDGVTIKVPDIQGYTPDRSTITGTMNPDGTVTPNETVNYIPNNIEDASTTINTPKGSKTISDLNGTVDKKGGVTIKVPDVQGYTPDKSTITGTMNPNGTVTPNETVNYTPNNIKDVSTTISTSKGDKTVSGLTGIVDDKNGVTIKVPDVPGYTPNKSIITGTMNPDGTVTPSETVNYTPNAFNDGKITISTPDGDKTITDLTGTVDNKNGVTIKVPDIQGYTPDKSIITGTMNPDGTVTPDEKVTYTGNPVNNQSLNIPTTKDSKDATQTITGLSGKVGDTLEVAVPPIDGYNSNVKTVKAVINPDGSITTADKVIYTKISSNNSNSNVTGNEATLEMKNQTITTYADKPDVQVYGLDSDNTMTVIKDRILPHHTNWKSDAVITIGGITYYRVATNEFVKTIQAYPYEALNLYIRTYNDSAKPLYRAEEDLIANKTLAPSSSWITDRKTYFINGEKYYRVATNEFVKATDVYVYSPVKITVAAHSDSSKKVYDAKGQLVENYALNANSNWKADSIAYINGDKYYRVATNKFVKADDVYVYTPAKLVVTTHADSAKNVYNDKGQLVKERTLGASSNWLADGTTYINGVKYYRVATDEFVKADDVDIRR
ncbi:SLAP domain-containing protein [Companilactobacillus paralimentarius]|uniref:SLAP domain-containing protein n=1 Tax=Companilactobacillus paralimentarius TaxID=83526 RepID=UPI002853094D|nr:SLAP domain-containing protein [Companilactobacillus paralimentarius]MDR4932401.1 SLAP domain-containing protein [Companilactobacillus paralimentarius]